MVKQHKPQWVGLLLALFFLTQAVPTITAQFLLPELNSLTIEIWPEFDRPESLVIYRVELSPNVPVPTRLTFRLPPYVETMHAVAFKENGLLYAISEESIELQRDDDALLLSLEASTSSIQFEYYDSNILTKQEQSRQLDFNFSTSYPIRTATFQVQEPVDSKNFVLTPAPSGSFSDSNGLAYSSIEIAGLAASDTFDLKATYQRDSDVPSAQMAGLTVEQTTDTSQTTGNIFRENRTIGYVLAAAGLVLLIGLAVFWQRSKQRKKVGRRRRPSARSVQQKRPPAKRTARTKRNTAPAVDNSPPGFCYKCGATLRPEAQFCHSCGAERRR